MKKPIREKRAGAFSLLLASLLFVLGGSAQVYGQAADVGLVTKLAGEAVYWNDTDQKQPAPVQNLMKVRQGDRLKIAAGGSLELLYFANGRQEAWQGPAIFQTGLEAGQAEQGGPPQVVMVPPKVSQRIGQAALPLPRASLRYGGALRLMGAKEAPPEAKGPGRSQEGVQTGQAMKDAEKTAQALQQKTKPLDFTPQLYQLSVLAELGQYQEMEKIIDGMLKQKPKDPALMALKKWAQAQARQPAGPGR